MNCYVTGNPGTGKTSYLVREAHAKIEAAESAVVFVDFDGEAADLLASRCPKSRTQDVIFFDPTIAPVGWNFLDQVPPEHGPLYTTTFKDTVKKWWGYDNDPTPVMDRVIYNTIAALLELKGSSLLDIEPLLTSAQFREKVLKAVKDEYVLRKWAYWGSKEDRDYDMLISSTENKAGEFSEDPRIRKILARSSFDLKDTLINRKVILLRLPQGHLGSKAFMVASIFLAHLKAIALSRLIHIPEIDVFINDVHRVDNPVVSDFLAVAERHGVNMTICNTYLDQLSPEFLAAVLGNCQKRVMFRMGIKDSELLERSFPFNNTRTKLHELANFKALVFENGGLTEVAAPRPLVRGDRRTAVMEQSARLYGI